MAENNKTRKKRDTSQKRDAILEGAVKAFTDKGFDATSMDKIAEVADVSKRTIYNHFPSKEFLFQAIVDDFLKQSKAIKPIQYSNVVPLNKQLKEFVRAELYLIDDPTRRGLSKLLTSTFLMDVALGNEIRGHYKPHEEFIIWLNAARDDKKLVFQSAELTAQIFYGLVEGCITWDALLTDGESLKNTELLLDEIVSVFISRYGVR